MSRLQRTIYLDHAATTPMRAAVLEAMQPYFSEFYGNPSSIHRIGRRANVALEGARRSIGEILQAAPREVLFTSGGTEGDNAALRGIALARRDATGANRIITTPVEHHAVLHTALDLRDHYGFAVTLLPVNHEGLVDVADVEAALGNGSDVALVSVMYANNEIGTIQPIVEIGTCCRAVGVPFHTDAVQAAGKLDLAVDALQVDALSVSAHKFHGPKGVGFLYIRSGTPFLPQQTGGSQEGDRRAGTENIPSIVGLAKAFDIAEAERHTEAERLRVLRNQLIGGVLEGVEGAQLTGPRTARLDNIASFVVQGAESEGILIALDLAGIAASSGSACASGSQRPSHVLEAIGVSAADARGALRFSLGHENTAADIESVLETLPRVVAQVKGAAPVML
ncbi:MAG: cysteine desulfurase [Caldilineaceae bacterium]|nr:cysteine desulfurase [Caldilineaceae bacterium]